jgi:hypothetical protein
LKRKESQPQKQKVPLDAFDADESDCLDPEAEHSPVEKSGSRDPNVTE